MNYHEEIVNFVRRNLPNNVEQVRIKVGDFTNGHTGIILDAFDVIYYFLMTNIPITIDSCFFARLNADMGNIKTHFVSISDLAYRDVRPISDLFRNCDQKAHNTSFASYEEKGSKLSDVASFIQTNDHYAGGYNLIASVQADHQYPSRFVNDDYDVDYSGVYQDHIGSSSARGHHNMTNEPRVSEKSKKASPYYLPKKTKENKVVVKTEQPDVVTTHHNSVFERIHPPTSVVSSRVTFKDFMMTFEEVTRGFDAFDRYKFITNAYFSFKYGDWTIYQETHNFICTLKFSKIGELPDKWRIPHNKYVSYDSNKETEFSYFKNNALRYFDRQKDTHDMRKFILVMWMFFQNPSDWNLLANKNKFNFSPHRSVLAFERCDHTFVPHMDFYKYKK